MTKTDDRVVRVSAGYKGYVRENEPVSRNADVQVSNMAVTQASWRNKHRLQPFRISEFVCFTEAQTDAPALCIHCSGTREENNVLRSRNVTRGAAVAVLIMKPKLELKTKDTRLRSRPYFTAVCAKRKSPRTPARRIIFTFQIFPNHHSLLCWIQLLLSPLADLGESSQLLF